MCELCVCVLKEDVFLSMVSAESLSVARKYKDTLNIKWRVPGQRDPIVS